MEKVDLRAVEVSAPMNPYFEKQKRRWLHEFAERQSTGQTGREHPLAVRLSVAGVPAEIFVSGAIAEAGENFLRKYLEDFNPRESVGEPVRIHYQQLPGVDGAADDPLWNDPCFELLKNQTAGGGVEVVGRDFAALVSADRSRVHAVGPRLQEGATDTIDNLLAFAIGPKLLAANALVFHASCVERGGRAYVFFGDSGVGKSTLAMQCFYRDGLKVLSGDQICLKLDKNGLWAHPVPSTIYEFKRGHPALCLEPRPVASLIHLVKRHKFEFRPLPAPEGAGLFLKQTLFQDTGSSEQVLDLVFAIAKTGRIHGEMSYTKGESFWEFLDKNLRNRS